jgi:hypothetical protein
MAHWSLLCVIRGGVFVACGVLLQWKVAAVDYNATAEMFMAFDNFRLIFGLSNLPITVLTILPYSIINTVCFKRKTFRVQSGAASKLPMEPGGVIDERNMVRIQKQ